MCFGISTSSICWSGWAFLGKVYLKVRRATLFWLLSTAQYLFATLVLASPTCNRRCNGVYSSAVKERPSDQRYARWECKRPSGEWGAGAAGAEPGPKGAGAAQAGPGGAGRWIKQQQLNACCIVRCGMCYLCGGPGREGSKSHPISPGCGR